MEHPAQRGSLRTGQREGGGVMADVRHPDNKPKGFGWWADDQKRDYCAKIFARGDRDTWLVMAMHKFGLLSLDGVSQALATPEGDK